MEGSKELRILRSSNGRYKKEQIKILEVENTMDGANGRLDIALKN